MVVAAVSMVVLIFPAISQDIGRFGEMFEIAEPDLMDQIQGVNSDISGIKEGMQRCRNDIAKKVDERSRKGAFRSTLEHAGANASKLNPFSNEKE